jgi:formamidopyrimidine-DNA glycosylase
VDIHNADRISPRKRQFADILSGATIVDIKRRGKNILIGLSNGYTLWVHLKMTGRFEFRPSLAPLEKHDHVVFHLAGNNRNLRFNDYRRFGYLRLYPTPEITEQKGLADLGPEPQDISFDDFLCLMKDSRRMIKPALLDQTFLAGLGNIYSDEALYRSRIHPRRLTDSLSAAKIKELLRHIRAVLRHAIRLMGTSVDTFTGLNGRPGRYQEYLLVYGREGEPCSRCERPIRREKIGSRSAHYCPYCQRLR